MKKIILITLIFTNLLIYIPTIAQTKKLVLNDKTIVIDPGHGEYPYARYNKFKLKNSKVF